MLDYARFYNEVRAGTVAPFIVIELVPGTAVITPGPQEVAALAGEAMRICPVPPLVGNGSDTETLPSGLADRFSSAMRRRVMLPSDSGPPGVKPLLTVSTGRSTVPAGVDVAPDTGLAMPG